MNIGFVSYFAFRPHVEHLFALSEIVKKEGHKVFFLSCDSAISTCYRRELTKSSRVSACMQCTLGGIRSFPAQSVQSARAYRGAYSDSTADYSSWGHSSACTIFRAESDADKSTAEFKNLRNRLSISSFESYSLTRSWIKNQQLDAVVCFNGRMDATRGVLEACRSENIRFVSMERTWGDGLLLLPDSDCLGLQEIHRMVKEFKDTPLTKRQAITASKIVVSRFLKKNLTEWRAYNLDSVDEEWPIKGAQKKVLILPSSFNEYDGHPEWKMKWIDQFDAFTNVIKELGYRTDAYIMRGHPNWSQNIGSTGGSKIEAHYMKWAKEHGILYIPGSRKVSTQNLIAQSDIVVLNGGSAAIEAGLLGKKIISLVETTYRFGGFAANYLSVDDKANLHQLDKFSSRDIIRYTLRFLYTWGFRVMQYTKEIKALDAINYRYDSRLDGTKILNIIEHGAVQADDTSTASDVLEENLVVETIERQEWENLDAYRAGDSESKQILFRRKRAFRFVDQLRNLFPPGDQ